MILLWSLVSAGLAGMYVAVMLVYWRGWRGLPAWTPPPDFRPRTAVTVVVPARNEAHGIAACLRSILEGSYPSELLEIIVVDDFSEDDTAAIVREFKRQRAKDKGPIGAVWLLSMADFFADEPLNSHKKKALEIAIAQARGDLIVTTDADCQAPEDWLRLVVSVFETPPPTSPRSTPPPPGRGVCPQQGHLPSPEGEGLTEERLGVGLPSGSGLKILAAPVVFYRERNMLQRFQSLDFLGMIGITGAGIQLGWQRMGNGANLAYPKAVFEAVGGFSGADARASGDDLFLLQKVARRWPGGVFFLKNRAAAVRTEALPDWRSFFQQRLRWGTKNAALPEPGPKIVLLLVFLFCWSIVLNAVLALFFGAFFLLLLGGQLAAKAVFDFVFLREMCRFFGRRDLLRWFWPSFFLHILYIAVVGLASLFVRRYAWKGRRVR